MTQPSTRLATAGPCALVALLVSVLVSGCGREPAPAPPAADPSTRRMLTGGEVVGYAGKHDNHAWRGIPYAAAPVGDLRWRAPRPAKRWQGTREALVQGASCPQFAPPGGSRTGEKAGEPTGSEDCLSVNVFAPRFAPDAVPRNDARLPVMLWIHGGGNTIGSSEVYDGGRLASRHGLVVFAVNYRMGAFGWFTHPSLRERETDPFERSGNWGTLDLIEALRWVRENAAAFGGDPENVTIFGESAGGTDVFTLLASPPAQGLFQRAIVQSGGLRTTPLAEAENLRDASQPGDEFSSGETLLRLLLADGAVDRSAAKMRAAAMNAAETAAFLRSRSRDQILATYTGERFGGMYSIPMLIRDGHVLPEDEPAELLARLGGVADVPTLLGTNRDENKLFLLFSSDNVRHLFGLPLWFADERAYELEAEYHSKAWKASGVDEPAEAMTRVRATPVFAYRFDWDEEPSVLWADFSKMLGAAHAIEIPFVFGLFDLGPGNRFLWDEERIPARDALSDAMMSYWANFAYTGDPGRGRSGSLEEWKAWDASGTGAPRTLVLDTPADGGIRMSSDLVTSEALLAALARDDRFDSQRERCTIFYQFAKWGRVLSEEEYAGVAGGACSGFPIDAYPWE
jgi:para-nitrobenzyl esterase